MVRSASRVSTPAPSVLRQEIDLSPSQPPVPPQDAEPISFWEQLYEVPEDQWASNGEKGFKVYLYEGPGNSPYIALITEPFDIEWVKQNFGGGVYRAQLNNPGGKIAASVRFTIEGESRRKPPQSTHGSTAPPAPTDSFQAQMLEIMREGQRRQEDLIRQLMERQHPPAPVATAVDPTVLFRGMVDMLKEMMPAAQPQMSLVDMIALVEKLRGPDLITVLGKAKDLGIIPSAGSGGDLVTQFKQLKEAAEVVGLGEGKGKSLGEAVIERLPDILEAGGKAMDKYQQIEATRLATAREVRAIQRGPVVTPPPAGAPAANSAPQHVIVGASPAGVPGLEVEAPGTAPEAIAEAERQDSFIKSKIVEMIANGDSGGEIIDFLDKIDKTICDRFGGASVDQIVYFFSTDAVLKKAAALPRFKPAIAEIVEELNAAPDEEMPPARPN